MAKGNGLMCLRQGQDVQHAIRRVKCDEQQPFCNRCISTGRKCDGYKSPPRASSTSSSGPSPERLDLPPTTAIIGTNRELRSFHFFQHNTAAQLTGFFEERFWDQLILRAAHQEPTIRHAVIALGSLHEHFENGNGLVGPSGSDLYRDDFALQEYNLAIKSLIDPFSSGRPQAMDVCLISCILFSCFETMQGRYGSAISHVLSGGKVLCEIEYDEDRKQYQHESLTFSTVPYVPMEVLEDIFMRMNFQVTQMVGGQKWNPYEQTSLTARYGQSRAAVFSSISEARSSFIYNFDLCRHALNNLATDNCSLIQADFKAWQTSSLAMLMQWSSALEGFLLKRGPSLTVKERKAAAILQIQKNIGLVSLQTDRATFDNQTRWDVFTPLFEDTISLAAEIVQTDDAEGSERKVRLSLDMGVVGPLYGAATCCRDPFIRRRAIEVMKSASVQEGVWNAYLTAKVAERVVEIEEQGLGVITCCEDVPDWARISDVCPSFDPVLRRAILRYARPNSTTDFVRTPVEEVIEW